MAKQKIALKKSEKLDFEPALNKAKADMAAEALAQKEWMQEVESISREPELPKRWGTQKRLTVATPGHLISDPTFIPETVELTTGGSRRVATHRWIDGQFRILTADGSGVYRWCANIPQRLSIHKSHGFRFSSYTKLFEDTGLFESNPSRWVINGDLVLMEISLDGWERQQTQARKIRSALEGAYGSELFAAGQRYGAPTFIENHETGVREYYT